LLITNTNITEAIREQFDKEKSETIKKYGADKVQFELKGYSEIKSDFKIASSLDEPIPEKIEIPIEQLNNRYSNDEKQWAFIDLSDILEDSAKYSTVITTIKGTVLQNIYRRYKNRLFNYNIRGYLGQNTVNKKMTETIEENPHNFYLFNNGISAICTELSFEKPHSGHGLQAICKNFQIINGAQTATTIGIFKNKEKLKDVRVLLRLTQTETIKRETKGLNKKIILYNNSQTSIKDSDFRSNDEIQTFLETNLRNYFYKVDTPHQRIIYLPKRLKYKQRTDEIYLNLETLAKCLYAFNYDPIRIYSNSKTLFDIDSLNNGMYWYIFGDAGEECTIYDSERLKKTAAISILWLYLQNRLKKENTKLNIDKKVKSYEYLSFQAKWHFLWAFGFIINEFYNEKTVSIINKIIDGKAFTKDIGFINVWFDKVAGIIQEHIGFEYLDMKEKEKEDEAEEEIEKKGGFILRNWLRNQKSFDKLKFRFKFKKKNDFPLNIE